MEFVKMPLTFNCSPPPFAASVDDTALIKKVQDTHKPNGRMFDVKPVMGVIEQIFRHASSTILITCKCTGGTDSHETTLGLLSGPILSVYPWEGKVVLILAAFAMSYGEFWLTGQVCTVNPLAKSVGLLKRMPELLRHVHMLKPKFDALDNLIKEILELTRCIIAFSELPVNYISKEEPAMVEALSCIPTAVYWIIKSAVTSSAQIVGLISVNHGLAHKVNNIHGHLKKQLEICLQIIEEKKSIEAYRILQQLFLTIHGDNMKILRTIFHSKDDYPFIRCSLDKKVHVEVLRRKTLLLLFSDLQIAVKEHLTILKQTHSNHGQQNMFEIVWVPIMESINDLINGENQLKEILQVAAEMPWLTVYPPPHPKSAFVKYVCKEWRFSKKAILVALDGQGKVTNPNALYMTNIWGVHAYPFSTEREESLWRAESWRLHFVWKDIDSVLSSWISEKKQICLYGGEDIDWIRSFTSNMKKITKTAGVSTEMVYVGKAHPGASIKKIIDTVRTERISAVWSFESISFFWMRLESMLHSLMQIQMGFEMDKIQQEVISFLTYGNSAHGCGLLSRGDHEMFVNEGHAFTLVLDNYHSWKDKILEKGFIGAFQAGYVLHRTADHCVKLVLPSSSTVHPIPCPQCKKNMERYLLLQCCGAQLVPNHPAATATNKIATATGTGTATAAATAYEASIIAGASTATAYEASTVVSATTTAATAYEASTIAGAATATAYEPSTIAGAATATAYEPSTIAGASTATAYQASTIADAATATAYEASTIAGAATATAYEASTVAGAATATATAYEASTIAGASTATAYEASTIAGAATATAYEASTIAGASSATAYEA